MNKHRKKLTGKLLLIVVGVILAPTIIILAASAFGLPLWVSIVTPLLMPYVAIFLVRKSIANERKRTRWIREFGWYPSDDANRSYMLRRLVFPHGTFKEVQETETTVRADSLYFKLYGVTNAFVLNRNYVGSINNNADGKHARQTETIGVIGLELPSTLPYFRLKKEDMTASPTDPLETESYVPNRKWKIFSDNDKYARSVLTPTIIDLLNQPGYFQIKEIVVTNGMIMALQDDDYEGGTIEPTLAGLYQLSDTIPDSVWENYSKPNPAFGRMNQR